MKYIIHIDDNTDHQRALAFVSHIIGFGLISGEGTARGPQHCYHTHNRETLISASCQKNKSGSETFTVWTKEGDSKPDRSPTTQKGTNHE